MGKNKRKAPIKDKDLQQLNVAINALKGAEHNPVDWAPIIKLVAPIVARLAVRYAVSALATRWNKRGTPKIRSEVSNEVADRIARTLSTQIR